MSFKKYLQYNSKKKKKNLKSTNIDHRQDPRCRCRRHRHLRLWMGGRVEKAEAVEVGHGGGATDEELLLHICS